MLKNFTLLACAILCSALTFGQDTTRTLSIEDTLNDNTPVFISNLDEDNSGGNVSGLLQSSRDVFAATAGFNFFAARFRIRGYQGDKTTIFINGVPTGDAVTGFSQFLNGVD